MSNPEQHQGILMSDFDGTAVKKFPKYRWQNWTKTHLPLIPGYPEFVAGARAGGLRPVNYLTIRKAGGQRERATNQSIADHGLEGLFEKVSFAGNKATKAKLLAQRAARFNALPVAMLEDYPDDLVPRVAQDLQQRAHPESPAILVVGAVDHRRRLDRLDDMCDQLRGMDMDIELQRDFGGGATVTGPSFLIDVVPLEPYSYDAGAAFAAHAVTVFQQAAMTG